MRPDGGLDGPMTALLPARRGGRLRLVAEGFMAVEALKRASLHVVTRQSLGAGVELAPLGGVVEEGSKAWLENVLTERRRSNAGLLAGLERAGAECVAVGDALAPRRLAHAVLDGARAGIAL